MDVEGLGWAKPMWIPDLVHDLFPAHHISRVCHEQMQEVGFPGGELDGVPVLRARPRGWIQAYGPDLDGTSSVVSSAPAKDRSYSCRQVPGRERLDDVVIGADLKPHDPVQLLAPGRQHDDGKVGTLTNSPSEVSPISVGEHDVQQD